jgi:5S rRNA maturation endonuclease (ribonuclease M5)
MDNSDKVRVAPLTGAELAAGRTAVDPFKDDGELVSPVPADAVAMPLVHSKWGKPSATWAYRDASGETLFYVSRFDPNGERKQFLPLSLWREPSGVLQWCWKGVPAPRPLYGLDRLAGSPDASVVICEGEKSADAAAAIFPKSVCVTSSSGSQSASKTDWSPLAGRQVLIWPDADKPGDKYADTVAVTLQGLGCSVSVVDALALASLAPDGGQREPVEGWDAADAIAEWQDIAALRTASHGLAKPFGAEAAEEASTNIGLDAEIKRLASLSKANYECERRATAKKFGIRTSILDRLVAAGRPGIAPGSGRPLELATPEPWPTVVNGAVLVAELTAAIRKYVVLTENDGLTAALWVLHTYCFAAFPCTPRLAITAPEKRCGKTTLLDVIGLLVPRPLSTANISAAATFRTIEVARPTLLIDEADTFLGESEELRGILNSGHRAGGQVVRTVGDDFEPRVFSTHCPIAIAQIGKLPDTLADRSVHISMKRRAPGEKVARFRHGRTPELSEAGRKAARWVLDNADAIRECDPDIPEAIYNGAADNWSPLLAIAEVIGGDLPARAKQAASAACGVEEEPSRGAELLADIREAFEKGGGDRMTSARLVTALVDMRERPWCECANGRELTQNGLARRLKNFGIRPKNIRFGDEQAKGFEREFFDDAFSRYLPCISSVPPKQYNGNKDLDENQSVPERFDGTDVKSRNSSNFNAGTAGTVQSPTNGVRAQNDGTSFTIHGGSNYDRSCR